MKVDGVIHNVRLATFSKDLKSDDYGTVESAAFAWLDGKIVYSGPSLDAPSFETKCSIDAENQWLTPGLIDCHTHLVYAGNRADEFERLRQGVSYAEIAQAGGGILRTVRQTRAAGNGELIKSAQERLNRLLEEGVTTVEIKSGYGLSLASELKMLEVIKSIRLNNLLDVSATCLAAHTKPNDFNGNHDEYIQWVIDEVLPVVKQKELAQCVDVFCESIAFSAEQTAHLFKAATQLGFKVKGHVEQLTLQHGADVVADFKGLSADHVEFVTHSQAQKLAQSDVVAVLLPGAFYYLNEVQKPPISVFRELGVKMAVATDLNPGTSPLNSLLAAANLSCVLFGLTPAEAWRGMTIYAAQALNYESSKGQLVSGFDADFVLWDCEHPRQIVHELNRFRPKKTWWRGKERNT